MYTSTVHYTDTYSLIHIQVLKKKMRNETKKRPRKCHRDHLSSMVKFNYLQVDKNNDEKNSNEKSSTYLYTKKKTILRFVNSRRIRNN